MYFAGIFLPNICKNYNEIFWRPATFVETFDCNIAFIDIIVQPLTSCQLFLSLSSIILKNILFYLVKNPISHQYKNVPLKAPNI